MDFRSEEEVKQALKCHREYMGKEPVPPGRRALFAHSCTRAFLWRVSCVPDTGLAAGNTAVSRMDQNLCRPGGKSKLTKSGERQAVSRWAGIGAGAF